MSYVQRFLNEFFQIEIYHSLGSYNSVVKKLSKIKEGLREKKDSLKDESDYKQAKGMIEEDLLKSIIAYNKLLRDQIHRSDKPQRHPCPPKSDLLWWTKPESGKYRKIIDFYSAAIEILKTTKYDFNNVSVKQLKYGLIFEPDILPLSPQFHQRYKKTNKKKLFDSKRIRFYNRKMEAIDIIGEEKKYSPRDIDKANLIKILMKDCFTKPSKESFRRFIIEISVDAHFRMHYIEHLRSELFEELMKKWDDISEKAEMHLKFAICVNTFIFTLSRAAPWIFAEDSNERNLILKSYEKGRIHLIPPRCIWIAQQLSLLALYRRAYCKCLLGKNQSSFNDYLKVQRLARSASRNIILSATHVHGAHHFLMALDALCEYRMGELYRFDYAHTCASEHFNRAYDRLEELRKIQEMETILEGSRWRIALILSMGKALFELGYLKRSLMWYIIAWRAFLSVTAEDSDLEINSKATDETIECLRHIRNEPDICKPELIKFLTPFISELKTARVSPRLRGLAAEILNRISHNLFILNLGETTKGELRSGDKINGNQLHALAFECVRIASGYDPKNTLVHSKILSIKKKRNVKFDNEVTLAGDQWPLGGGRFERFSRVYEHYLLKEAVDRYLKVDELRKKKDEMLEDPKLQNSIMAASLIVDLLTQTDSSNVKLSLIYKYLTRKRRLSPEFRGKEKPRLEFISLRRYSSFFPFLPRPSSFRTLGGGYLVRLHGSANGNSNLVDRGPFGIAIDPGSDYVETLYRAGYSLADIDMIIVTHDHADHIASLDPILSLMQYRGILGHKKGTNNAEDGINTSGFRQLLVIGNESVKNRYHFYNEPLSNDDLKNLKYVRVSTFDEWDDEKKILPKYIVEELELEIKAYQGIHLDSARNHSFGIRISIGGINGASVGITGDTILPDLYNKWLGIFDSDVLITHLSSVPLSQLRLLAQVWGEGKELEWLRNIWDNIKQSKNSRDIALYNKIGFAFWLRDRDKTYTNLLGKFKKPYEPPGEHLYLNGIIKFAKEYQKKRREKRQSGLFIVSELREELATFRTKVAKVLNDNIFRPKESSGESKSNEREKLMALTADIGLSVFIEKNDNKTVIRVLCSNCDVDNDYTADERYHDPTKIQEVCVKGEDEGIYYNCEDHDPGIQTEPFFVERMERYDIFSKHIS